eukprot:m.112853 g.112853  ORF g.112853 m.112853 type:complete len:88 (-) comp17045_c0_seq1:84-347(-)
MASTSSWTTPGFFSSAFSSAIFIAFNAAAHDGCSDSTAFNDGTTTACNAIEAAIVASEKNKSRGLSLKEHQERRQQQKVYCNFLVNN